MAQVTRSPKIYDVIVVGSGAGGGMAAKILTEGGLNVAMLEAGPAGQSRKRLQDVYVAVRTAASRRRCRRTCERRISANFWRRTARGRLKASRTPPRRGRIFSGFVRASSAGARITGDGSRCDFLRSISDRTRATGSARTGPSATTISRRTTTRWSPTSACSAQKKMCPARRMAFFCRRQSRAAPRLIVKKACDKLNIICIPSRLAILTKSVNGRLPCHYCGQCGRGCTTASNFSSSQVLIPPAMATGKLTLITGAMAREVLVGKDGKAQGVSYIDKATRTEKRISARAVVLAASACESARLLLNSKSPLFPDGLANSSGTVGRYLTDSVGSGGEGYFPQLEKMTPHNHDGTGGMHMYMPWWKFDRKNDFPRGYHIEFGGGRELPNVGMFNDLCHHEEGYGVELKRKARKDYGTTIGFAGRGEMIPNPDTYCEIDPDVVDEWGIPVLRFHFKWSEYELRQAKDMQETFRAIVEMAGGQYLTKTPIDGPRAVWHRPGRKDHSRSGNGADGSRSEDLGAERILPGARCEESFRYRWGSAGHESGQESDADDHGACPGGLRSIC